MKENKSEGVNKKYMELARIIGEEPTFENLCIYMTEKKEQTTGEFMHILWWLWCETYPENRESLNTFSDKHLEVIINYIKN